MDLMKLLFVWFLLYFSTNSYALLEFEDGSFPEFITSARALAMGNAFICKVDDPNAAFYNPAGLGTVRRTTFHLTNLHLELNKGFINLTEGNVVDVLGKMEDNFSARGVRDNLASKPGNLSHAKVNFFPNLTSRYFQIGYMYSQTARANLDATTADIEFAERRDHGPVAALNFSLFGGVIKFGASAVLLNRRQLQLDFAPTDPISISDNDYTSGSGLFVTGGTRITLPWAWLPTFSGVIRNATGAEWEAGGDGPVTPPEIPTTYDLGFSLTPQIGNTMRVHMELNYKDFSNEYSNISKKRKLLAGIEFDIARKFFLRFGYGDGFGSAGIGIQGKRVYWDLTTYAVDLSQAEIRGREDRRFVLSMASGY